jgi:hypothetical protein
MALITTGLVVSCSSGQSEQSAQPPARPKFDGLYEVQTDLTKRTVNYAPDPSNEKKPFKMAVRSACVADNVCTATALMLSDDMKEVPNTGLLVFDLVDGHWLSVKEVTDGSCQLNPNLRKVTAPYFSIWTVDPKDDGPMTARGLYVAALECMNISDVPATFTRTGDAPADVALPDPASQPKRVTSPAAVCGGKYSGPLVTADHPDWKFSQTWAAETRCLRAGNKCLTTVATTQKNEAPGGGSTAFSSVYIFENGRWTGGSSSGPITNVIVDQAVTSGDPCPSALNSQITLTRTGD